MDEEVKEFCVCLEDLHQHLQQTAGLLFTAADDTSALYAGNDGLYHFDLAVAVVQKICAAEITRVLQGTHHLDSVMEYSIILISKECE